jgi:hypothetical protein
MANRRLDLLKRVSQPDSESISPSWKPENTIGAEVGDSPLYPSQQNVFSAVKRHVRGRDEIVVFTGPDSSAGVSVGEGMSGVGGKDFLASPTGAPDAPGSFSAAKVGDYAQASWTTPLDQTGGSIIYSQLRFRVGSTALTTANFTASGTLGLDWTTQDQNWYPDAHNSGVTTTGNAAVSGDLDGVGTVNFGIRYKNLIGNIGALATASATF